MSVRPITDTLRQIAGGHLLDTASDQLADLVRVVDSNGGSGKLTIELTVKKATRGGAMLVTGKSTLKKPADEPLEAMLFATPEGNLITDDPRQQKLDLKRVESASDAPPAVLKTA
ncbi:hypothetical protein KY49_686 [Burkholderia sp. MSHR3999]|uniref:hypothetical protein n=1 Tax=Burkholderia sp. MSHR3999 TaxID=1542965 RepID=UPI0005AD1609|nr:hypothetical protein [Burkholderia sp. MSHR3999]KIP13414.1 hypothetical protein KY49_686 [Burkholderia sp. MSHR3999]